MNPRNRKILFGSLLLLVIIVGLVTFLGRKKQTILSVNRKRGLCLVEKEVPLEQVQQMQDHIWDTLNWFKFY
ncbi:hypothetical protein N42HA_02616 [Lactococcus lactis]|nr:hypothetical protein [Lactococcus lactis]